MNGNPARLSVSGARALLLAAALACTPSPARAQRLFFDWDVRPTGFTTYYERQEVPAACEFCTPITVQGIRSGYTGGVYGVDADGDGVRDGSLTAEFELISEVSPTPDGRFSYTWQLRNLGTGSMIAFLGSGPDFGISSDNPLLGAAGPDRITGTSDDLLVGQVVSRTFLGNQPRTYAWGGTLNPSTGLGAMLYAPELFPPIVEIELDITPGSLPNSVRPGRDGVIPVAIRTTPDFDAATVMPSSVRFGPSGIEAAPVHTSLEDVDGDGDLDLVLQFETGASRIACGQRSAVITGTTVSGQKIQGVDSIVTVGCK